MLSVIMTVTCADSPQFRRKYVSFRLFSANARLSFSPYPPLTTTSRSASNEDSDDDEEDKDDENDEVSEMSNFNGRAEDQLTVLLLCAFH